VAAETVRVLGHYAVQRHSTTRETVMRLACYWNWTIITCILSRTVSTLLQITGQIFASDRGGVARGDPMHAYEIWLQKTRNVVLSCGVKCVSTSWTVRCATKTVCKTTNVNT